MSNKRDKKFPDRKPHDQRVMTTLTGPVGKILDIKPKAIWQFMVCCIDKCSQPTRTRGAALCAFHKAAIRKVQFGLGSTRYRDRTDKPKDLRLQSRNNGRPTYRALLNPEWARKKLGAKSTQTGKLETPEARALFLKELEAKQNLVKLLASSGKAVKRDAKRKQAKRKSAQVAAKARAKTAARKAA